MFSWGRRSRRGGEHLIRYWKFRFLQRDHQKWEWASLGQCGGGGTAYSTATLFGPGSRICPKSDPPMGTDLAGLRSIYDIISTCGTSGAGGSAARPRASPASSQPFPAFPRPYQSLGSYHQIQLLQVRVLYLSCFAASRGQCWIDRDVQSRFDFLPPLPSSKR